MGHGAAPYLNAAAKLGRLRARDPEPDGRVETRGPDQAAGALASRSSSRPRITGVSDPS
jgi:hypothetical protein